MLANFDDLKNKVCVITGGAGVLGTALSKALASAGIKVVILGRNQEKAANLAAVIEKEFGTEAAGLHADVLNKDSLQLAKTEINSRFGKINFLVNCAGGNSPKATTPVEMMTKEIMDDLDKTFYGLDIEAFKYVFDVNLFGTVLPTMIFTRDMLELSKGNVVNISSMSAYHPLTKVVAYSAAKASINNITEWMAVHLAKVNIRVNAIAPGFFLTEQNRFLLTDEKTGSLTVRGHKIISNTPLGRFGQPEELQGTLLYLLSDISKFVTGIVIPVDGGFNAYAGV